MSWLSERVIRIKGINMLFGSICTNQHVAYVKSYACHGASADLRGGTGTRASLSKLIKYMNKITGRTKVKTCPSQKKNLYFASPSFVPPPPPQKKNPGSALAQAFVFVNFASPSETAQYRPFVALYAGGLWAVDFLRLMIMMLMMMMM